MALSSSAPTHQNLNVGQVQNSGIEPTKEGARIEAMQSPPLAAQSQQLSHEPNSEISVSRFISTRVVFFKVNDGSSKLKKIVEMAQFHFGEKESLLFFVEEEKGGKFVDELLWKQPVSSFLPHTFSDEKTNDLIVITKSKNNVNNARIAFNLCPTSLFLNDPFKIIYEFEDLTTPAKKKLSSQRFDDYKRRSFFIEAR